MSYNNGELESSKLCVGKWKIFVNEPWGFYIKNECGDEYHFHSESNGWFTAKGMRNKGNPSFMSFNAYGQVNFQPVLVDKESTKKLSRMKELASKENIGLDEAIELLELTGLRKNKRE